MFELNGKYNSAKIFTDNCDAETISQIQELLNQRFTADSSIRIMPDCHAGKGCTIGTTMTLTDKVVPNLVGVDIGCGMYAVEISDRDIDFDKLDRIIREKISHGCNIHKKESDDTLVIEALDKIKAPFDRSRALCSVGTLGGGNHFIEVDRDSNGAYWLVVHTGSRHLGVEICDHYQKVASFMNKTEYDEPANALIEKLKSEGRQAEISVALKNLKETYESIPEALCYVDGENFADYINDMKQAQRYAIRNRTAIANTIISAMGWSYVSYVDTIHNYIDTDTMMLRKGAVSARKNEILLIPMNMRDGSLLCIGKGNADWNCSAPHGAGRIMSRSQAKANVSLDEYKKSMEGIYTSCVNESTIDESPMAYKPMEEIVECVKDTVDIVDIIKPVYNFKSN